MKTDFKKLQDGQKLATPKNSKISKPKQSKVKPARIERFKWIKAIDPPKRVLEGYQYGINCVVIRYSVDEVGEGPNLHVHPYDEVFHILKGRAEFTVGSEKLIAEEGAIVIGPANIPHAYKNLGPRQA